MSGPVFTEQTILLRVMEGDNADARSLLEELFDNELATFGEQAQALVDLIEAVERARAVAR